MRRVPIDLTTTGALSLCAHLALAFVVVALRLASGDRDDPDVTEPPPEEPSLELDVAASGTATDAALPDDRVDDAVSPSAPRGENDPRPDSPRAGRGGEATVTDPAQSFANRDDGLSRDKSLPSRTDRSQVARLRASHERRSYEDRRAVRVPDTELTLFAVAEAGIHPEERRAEAEVDPGSGVLSSAPRDRAGLQRGDEIDPEAVRISDAGAASTGARQPDRATAMGGAHDAPGVGRARSTGTRESPRVRTQNARPQVEADDPSVFSDNRGRPTDDIDLEQEIQARQMSILQASSAGGKAGAGKGGSPGGDATGSGGTAGPGSRATQNGAGGDGPPDPREAARLGYVRALLARIYPFTERVFPRRAALEGRSGAVTVTLVIEADGTLSSARVSAASGIAEFDENVRAAVVRAGPFGKLPPVLGNRFVFPLRFASPNPVVRPEDPGNGPRM